MILQSLTYLLNEKELPTNCHRELKSELYDLYFRSYSFMIIFILEMLVALDSIPCVDGFYDRSCLKFLILFEPFLTVSNLTD